ncbi:protein MKS1 [Malania oleifera]|uniref:protein MKS1 n=1 Tax=Malania oleifera TaxID=397392 RepID=UPI0025AEB098|nr:protein MKS1 [Malania oleifera]
MDSQDIPAGNKPSPARRELQGPRPAPLRVSKDSYKIKKPPISPGLSHARRRPPHGPSVMAEPPQPMIIYTVSPKVIHTTVSDFMLVVQRLTGSSSSSTSAVAATEAVSPAARLASIEKTSPSEREKERDRVGDLMGQVEGAEMRQIPGILSPAPATLPVISPALFSPASDPNTLSFLHDLSPFFPGSSSFVPSPSGFLSAPLVSPFPSPDLFNPFFDF